MKRTTTKPRKQQGVEPSPDSPRVSIGLPVYNEENFIRRALDDLLRQTFEDFELIISDNASTDRTQEICQEYTERDKRVRYYRNRANIGPTPNYQRVLNLASGCYFMWASCDDRWNPAFVAALVKELDDHPDAGLAMSAIHRYGEDGTHLGGVSFSGEEDPNTMNYLQMFLALSSPTRYHLFVYGLYRRDFLKKAFAKPFPPVPATDRLFMCQVALATKIRYVHEFLHTRTIRAKSAETRNAEYEDLKISKNDPFGYSRTWLEMEKYLWASEAIPPHRKHLIRVGMDNYAEKYGEVFYRSEIKTTVSREPKEYTSQALEEMAVINQLRSRGNLKEAHMLASALALEYPDSTDLLNLLAEVKFQVDQKKGAKDILLDIMKLDSNHTQVLNNLAVVLWDEKNLREAISYGSNAVQADPENINAYLNLAEMLTESGDLKEGLVHLETVLQKEPNHIEALKFSASINLQLGEFQQAYDLISQAKLKVPDDDEITVMLANIELARISTTE